MSDLIRTGTAAQLLGTSRQHVVDLIQRGLLRNLGTSIHRRVDRDEVEALLGRRGTRDDRQSLWLHLAVAGKLARDPGRALRLARRNLALMERAHGGRVPWLRRWGQVLDAGPEHVVRVLVADTQEGRELRQNSPFAGLLTDRERRQAIRGFRDAVEIDG